MSVFVPVPTNTATGSGVLNSEGFPEGNPDTPASVYDNKNQGLVVPGLGPTRNILDPGGLTGAGIGAVPLNVFGGDPGSNVGAGDPNVPTTLLQGLQILMEQGTKDPASVRAIQEQLIKAGYLNPGETGFQLGAVSVDDPTYQAYASLLNDAVVSGTDLTKILAERAKTNPGGSKLWQAATKAASGKPTTTTSTSSSVNLTSAPDAGAIANSETEDLLGRRVTTGEAQQYQSELNSAEEATPSDTTTTQTTDPNTGDSTSSSTSSGGIGAGGADQLAQNDIIANQGREYAQTQGDQIYDLFDSLLNGAA